MLYIAVPALIISTNSGCTLLYKHLPSSISKWSNISMLGANLSPKPKPKPFSQPKFILRMSQTAKSILSDLSPRQQCILLSQIAPKGRLRTFPRQHNPCQKLPTSSHQIPWAADAPYPSEGPVSQQAWRQKQRTRLRPNRFCVLLGLYSLNLPLWVYDTVSFIVTAFMTSKHFSVIFVDIKITVATKNPSPASAF